MSFTDEDFKMLKEDLKNFEHKFISIEACRSLLARLEAAEKAAEHGDWCGCPKGKCTYDAWRKACGT